MKIKIIISITLLFFLGTSQADTFDYRVTNLGALEGTPALGYGVSSNGLITGVVINGNGFLYEAGSFNDLGALSDSGATGIAVNASGQVTGTSNALLDSGLTRQRAFLFEDGVIEDLGTLGTGWWSTGEDINDSGQVVGSSATTNQSYGHAFLYSNGIMQDLGTLDTSGPNLSGAHGISDNGLVTGWSRTGTTPTDLHAFMYENETMYDLGSLISGGSSTGRDVNNSGHVTGEAEVASGQDNAFLYRNGTMINLGTLTGSGRSRGLSINNNGIIVGESSATDGLRAFMYADGTMLDLNSLIVNFGGLAFLTSAQSINDRGDIVGLGAELVSEKCVYRYIPMEEVCTYTYETRGFLATVVPLPASVWLLGSALGLLGGLRRVSRQR